MSERVSVSVKLIEENKFSEKFQQKTRNNKKLITLYYLIDCTIQPIRRANALLWRQCHWSYDNTHAHNNRESIKYINKNEHDQFDDDVLIQCEQTIFTRRH